LPAQRRGHGLALGIVEGIQEKGEIVMHRGILLEMPALRSPCGPFGAAFAAIRRSRSTGGITSGVADPLVGSDGDHGISDAARYDVRLATCHYRPCCGSAGT